MKDQFQFGTYCKDKYTSSDVNILSRVMNSIVKAINNRRLPQAIIIFWENDFIDALEVLDTKVTIAASLYGSWLEWMCERLDQLLADVNGKLPEKSRRQDGTAIYWVASPSHKNYSDEKRVQIAKFNNCLNSVVKLYDSMRIIKLKEKWDLDNADLVNRKGILTELGVANIYESLDASVKYNLGKRMVYLAKTAYFRAMEE